MTTILFNFIKRVGVAHCKWKNMQICLFVVFLKKKKVVLEKELY